MEILSVGIDIGTTTTQLIFSRLVIENKASAFTVPHISIISKEIIYRSAIYFTPFINATDIDGDGILQLVRDEFASAGLTPEQISTGAVIITGEAARKQNADIVLGKLSSFAGQFVVSTAGPDLESIIAGKGSGACAYSDAHSCSTVNVDIGGGTTNIATYSNGEATSYCCLDIGGRQVRLDANGNIEYISPSAQEIANSIGLTLQIGQLANTELLTPLTDCMADLIYHQLFDDADCPLLERIRTRGSSPFQRPQQKPVVFLSGGVADCVFAPVGADFPFSDIGVLLGRSLRNSRLFREAQIDHSLETLRATVVGAGVHLVSISGSTITFTHGLLPLRDLPVVKLTDEEMRRWRQGDDDYVAERLRWSSQATDNPLLALGWDGWKNPSFVEIVAMAERVVAVYNRQELSQLPMIIIIEEDMAKSLGQAIQRMLPQRPLICVDGVGIRQGDYVDLGSPIMNDVAIPVVVKTLVIG